VKKIARVVLFLVLLGTAVSSSVVVMGGPVPSCRPDDPSCQIWP
jgi:hypothetical protein